MTSFDVFQNKKIAILGYGREGKSSLKFLLKIGVSPKNITILDGAKQIEGLAENFECLMKNFDIEPEFNIIMGEKYLDNLKKFDLIIKTPGVSIYHEKIAPYKHKITTQAQIFFDYYQGKVIAVSGTKGKSTTSTLLYETIKQAKKDVLLIGNIGNSVLDYLDIKDLASQKKEYAVFEVSSYMLEGLKKSNYISILLNIYSDHSDWHNGLENYKNAKFNLLNGSRYNLVRDEIIDDHEFDKQDIKDLAIHMFGHRGEFMYKNGIFSIKKNKIIDDKEILLQGEHNMMNICAVFGVCDIMKIEYSVLEKVLKKFQGLSHRMENIGTYGGITRIDDAISTTPESTIQAIKTFGKKIDTIFLGGTDREYVFDELVKTIMAYDIKNIILFPESGKRIFKIIKQKDAGEIRIFQTDDMKEAVKFAYKYTDNNKICLLSTASPSYTLWKNFEEKGHLFQGYVRELA